MTTPAISLSDLDTRVAAVEAGGVTRAVDVDLQAAAAWADMVDGATSTVAIDAATTTFYEVEVQVSWAGLDGALNHGADSTPRAAVQVAVTRDATTGITVKLKTGGTYWTFQVDVDGTITDVVQVKPVDDGAGGWKLQAQNAGNLTTSAVNAHVKATVKVLSTQAWNSVTNATWPADVDFVADLPLVGASCTVSARATSGGAVSDLTTRCANLTDIVGTDCSVTVGGTYTLDAGTQVEGTGSTIRTSTWAAATTHIYDKACTSVSVYIAQVTAGAGGTMTILSGKGAAGSANGVFTIGLPGSNTALGAAVWVSHGATVGGVSDKFYWGTGTPGALTEILRIYQPAATYTRIGETSGSVANLQMFSSSSMSFSTTNTIALSGGAITLGGSYVESSGQISIAFNNVTFSASLTLDCSLGNHHATTLTAAITSLQFTNERDGALNYVFSALQDGTGGWGISGWDTAIDFGSYSSSPDLTPGYRTVWRFRPVSASKLLCEGREVYTS